MDNGKLFKRKDIPMENQHEEVDLSASEDNANQSKSHGARSFFLIVSLMFILVLAVNIAQDVIVIQAIFWIAIGVRGQFF